MSNIFFFRPLHKLRRRQEAAAAAAAERQERRLMMIQEQQQHRLSLNSNGNATATGTGETSGPAAEVRSVDSGGDGGSNQGALSSGCGLRPSRAVMAISRTSRLFRRGNNSHGRRHRRDQCQRVEIEAAKAAVESSSSSTSTATKGNKNTSTTATATAPRRLIKLMTGGGSSSNCHSPTGNRQSPKTPPATDGLGISVPVPSIVVKPEDNNQQPPPPPPPAAAGN